ncbi:hypothetical protein Tco_1040645 [Tanacetum coccineum]
MTNHVAHLDKENQTNKMVNGSLTAVLERYKERVTIFEQRLNVDLNKRKKLIDSQMNDLIRDKYAKLTAFWQEIDTLKETLSNLVKENESLSKTLTVFKTESKEKESKYIDKEIVLEKQSKELENIISLGYQNPFHLKKAQRIQPTLYDGSVIAKEHAVIFLFDDEETLILEEESRSKMLDKQNDLILIEKKIKISPIDYSKVEAPSELPKVSLVNESLKKLKYQLANFDNVMKKRTTSNAITAGAWGFEHTKACFLSIDNDQLLTQTVSQEIMHIAMNSMDILDVKKPCVNECNKCLELETELLKKKDLIEKDVYDNLLKTQSPEKDTVVRKLKDRIKSLCGKDRVENVMKDIDEIESINIEMEHSVAKLLLENENLRKEREHLKSIYKDQFDSIRKIRVQSKEHCDSVISQIIAKSAENSDLNDQLQKKVFAITALKNELRKPKGKNVADTTVSKPNVTIAPGMLKLDIEPIS